MVEQSCLVFARGISNVNLYFDSLSNLVSLLNAKSVVRVKGISPDLFRLRKVNAIKGFGYIVDGILFSKAEFRIEFVKDYYVYKVCGIECVQKPLVITLKPEGIGFDRKVLAVPTNVERQDVYYYVTDKDGEEEVSCIVWDDLQLINLNCKEVSYGR
jgi:hypothetical protein